MINCATVCSHVEAGLDIYWFANLVRPFPPHIHEKAIIGCLAKGARLLRLPGQELLLSADDLVFIPAFTTHGCADVAKMPSQWLCVQFPAALLAMDKPCVLHSPVFCQRLREAAAMASGRNDPEKLLEILDELRPQLPKCALPDKVAGGFTSIYNFSAWLQTELSEKIGLDDMAARCHLSKYAFLRSFQRALGITPYRYLQSLRIAKAQQLLRQGISLAQCASSSGFYDQAHFNKIFKASMGVTPGLWQSAQQGARQ